MCREGLLRAARMSTRPASIFEPARQQKSNKNHQFCVPVLGTKTGAQNRDTLFVYERLVPILGTKSCPQNWDTKTAHEIAQIFAHGAARRLFPAFCNAACGVYLFSAAPRPDASAPEQNHRDCAARVTPLPFVVQRSSAIDTRCVGHITDIWQLRYLNRRSKRIFGARGAWRRRAH